MDVLMTIGLCPFAITIKQTAITTKCSNQRQKSLKNIVWNQKYWIDSYLRHRYMYLITAGLLYLYCVCVKICQYDDFRRVA